MISSKYKVVVIALVLLVSGLIVPQISFGQDSGTNLKQPRNYASGGAVAARRPGIWLSTARANHAERQQKAIHGFGGANYSQTEGDVKPSMRKALLTALVQGLSDFVAMLADSFDLLLGTSGITPVETPEVVE